MGSDHVPITNRSCKCLIKEPINFYLRLNLKRANWKGFEENVEISVVENERRVDKWNSSLTKLHLRLCLIKKTFSKDKQWAHGGMRNVILQSELETGHREI